MLADLAIATVAGITAYLLLAPLQSTLSASIGLSPSAVNAAGAAVLVAFALTIRRFTASTDTVPCLSATAIPQAPPSPEMPAPVTATTAQIVQELRDIRTFNNVLRSHLGSVVTDTEMAALDIANHLQEIDTLVTDLLGTVHMTSTTNTATSKSGAPPVIAVSETETMSRIHASGQQLTERLMDALAGIQFQDAARQQIEQVVSALDHLDKHAHMLAEHLHKTDDPHFTHPEFQPLSNHLDRMYDNYVMASQRDTHLAALGKASEKDCAPAATPKIELF